MLVANLLTPNGNVGCQTLKPSKELSDAYNLYMNPKTLLVAKPSFLEGGAGLPSSKPQKKMLAATAYTPKRNFGCQTLNPQKTSWSPSPTETRKQCCRPIPKP